MPPLLIDDNSLHLVERGFLNKVDLLFLLAFLTLTSLGFWLAYLPYLPIAGLVGLAWIIVLQYRGMYFTLESRREFFEAFNPEALASQAARKVLTFSNKP